MKRRVFITINQIVLLLTLVSGCISDPGVSKNRGNVVDYSKSANNMLGCGTGYLVWSSVTMCSPTGCPAGSHIASTSELLDAKNYINDIINLQTTTALPPNGQVPQGGVVDQNLLSDVEGSAGICLTDLPPKRPTGQVYINTDFCSCLKGKSDIVNDCAATCTSYPYTDKPMLYLSTTVGPDIQLNSQLGNLEGWCKNSLIGVDRANPQCSLSVNDGVNNFNVPINTISGNRIVADLTLLSLNKTYIVKIAETTSGSNATSAEFQLRRVAPPASSVIQVGALKVAPISQYTCLSYGITIPGSGTYAGQVQRDTFVRLFYYFAANESPPPMPPLASGVVTTMVCHDETLYPGNDTILTPRLELIPQHFSMWDKSDPRLARESADANARLTLNSIIEQRLRDEFNTTSTQPVNIFRPLTWANRPGNAGASVTPIAMGVFMTPFTDQTSGKSTCPTHADLITSTDPQFRIIRDYVDSTEGIYFGEKEPEIIMSNNTPTYVYGTMLVTEGIIKKYGFYVENGLKIKADQAALDTRTIYYYWPVNKLMDPLLQGTRKLFTVKNYDTLNGNQPTNIPTQQTSDKRFACVPTTTVP